MGFKTKTNIMKKSIKQSIVDLKKEGKSNIEILSILTEQQFKKSSVKWYLTKLNKDETK